MPTRNVNLSESHARFIKSAVRKGRYQNASEVVRAGLRLLEEQQKEHELRLSLLRRLAEEGFAEIQRGEYVEVLPGGLDAFMSQLDREVRSGVKE